MDLRPIEARADEFFTWIGRFDSGQRVDAAFASAADVPALIDEVKRLREKIDVDRAMHEAFRPEVVAEVAVLVSDEMDWQAVADWCGGTIGSAQEPSGEYTSSITIPGVGDAYQGMWIVQRHDLTFAIRATLEGPSAESVARLTARTAVPALTAAVRDVLALHRTVGHGECSYYPDPSDAHWSVPYPCPTVRALATHLDLTNLEGDPR